LFYLLHQFKVFVAGILLVQKAEVPLPHAHAAEAIGAVHAVLAKEEVGASAAAFAFGAVGAVVAIDATLRVGGVRALLAGRRMGAAVALLAIRAEHTTGALGAFLALEGAGVRSSRLVLAFQLRILTKKFLFVHRNLPHAEFLMGADIPRSEIGRKRFERLTDVRGAAYHGLMNRTFPGLFMFLFVFVASCFLFSGCGSACKDLGDKICDCQVALAKRQQCKTALSAASDNTDLSDAEENKCQAILDSGSCTCDVLLAGDYAACGLAKDAEIAQP
jgi:hypothetical protein